MVHAIGPSPSVPPLPQRLAEAPRPAFRRLRAYAFDPSLDTQLDTAVVNQITLKVPWEAGPDGKDALQPGPVGEYLEVIDHDPASECFYTPVDLNHPHVLAHDGLRPSEGNPQFHQQMVYAVTMTTIKHFERALGRLALWSSRHEVDGKYVDEYVPRLRIYPHALREANAYYSPVKKALLFGYFPASAADPGRSLPGGTVFTCLSHDIVAHETTHALLDGIHPRFGESSNPDVLAFHEAFADIVALFQHFAFPEVLRHQIARTKGDLGKQSLLGELAQQFGQAIGRYGALRSAIGAINPVTRQWEPAEPDPGAMFTVMEAHDRGAILVAAVFDAFLSIYKHRVADLLRIATGGTGVLPQGEISPDLVNRLAQEASKSAQHMLTMCIRALDYCPPVDLTFGEYLRALLTADEDIVPDDDLGYRIAVIEAFRRRGIYPRDVRTLSLDSLRWQKPAAELPGLPQLLKGLQTGWDLSCDRREVFEQMRKNRSLVHAWLSNEITAKTATMLGLTIGPDAPQTKRVKNRRPKVEVHSLRPLRRVGPDGQLNVDLILEMTQKREVRIDPSAKESPTFVFRGGCTLLVDLENGNLRYCILKNIMSESRLQRQREFLASPARHNLHRTYFGERDDDEQAEPFALLHRQF